jgi:hypothetical protein
MQQCSHLVHDRQNLSSEQFHALLRLIVRHGAKLRDDCNLREGAVLLGRHNPFDDLLRLGQVSDGQSRFYALTIRRGRSMVEIPALENDPSPRSCVRRRPDSLSFVMLLSSRARGHRACGSTRPRHPVQCHSLPRGDGLSRDQPWNHVGKGTSGRHLLVPNHHREGSAAACPSNRRRSIRTTASHAPQPPGGKARAAGTTVLAIS